MEKHAYYSRGAGVVEVLVATALLLTVFVGFYGVLLLGIRLATENKARTGAQALALERVEYIHSLDYNDIGISDGTPDGILSADESLTLNNVTYDRRTVVVYHDEPKDGLGVNDEDGDTNDYKRIKVEIVWVGPNGPRASSVVTDVAPPTGQ